MNANPTPTGDPRFDELVAQFLEALDRGQAPDRTALLAAAPDLADRLRAFFADHDRLHQAVGANDPFFPPTDAYTGPVPEVGTTLKYVGDYQLLNELARGGMGVVYKARQQSLGRIVALKMILRGELAKPEERFRFKQEAEAAAGLDHPNIVPIYEVGEHENQPYFSMKLIEGVPLGRWLNDRPSRRQIVELLAQAAEAIDHAHRRGVLHRDLKPGNILVGASGGPPCPYVTDFGLAKRMTAAGELTQSGDKLGTPAYMAPEQIRSARGVTTAVDVWALGVVLYESLTGKKPFEADDAITLFRQIAEQEPAAPRVLTPDLDNDLQTIILKCLEKELARRYESAADVAAELRRWLNGEPILARPAGQFEKAWRWCKRNPAISGLTAAVAASLLLATGLSLGLANWALGEKDRADVNAMQANLNADRAETTLARSFLRPFDEGFWQSPAAIGVSTLQVHPLWELAENRGDRVWFKTIDEALKEPRTTRQLLGNAQVLLHAAVGLDPAKRDKLADYFLTRLRDPDWKEKHNELALLLVTLGGMDTAMSERVGHQLVAALEKETDASKLNDLAQALDALAGRLEPAAAAQFAARLLAVMEKETDASKLEDLAQALGALAGRLEPAAAAPLVQKAAARLVAVMEKETDASKLEDLALALDALAGRLEPVAAAPMVEKAAAWLVAVMEKETDASKLSYLAQALDALAGRLEPAAAAPLVEKAAARLVAVKEKETDASNLYSLAQALGALAGRLEPSEQDRCFAIALLTATGDFMDFNTYEGTTPSDELLGSWLSRPSPTLLAQRLGAGFNSLAGLPPAAFAVNLARAVEPFPARFSDEFMVELLHRPIGVGPWRRVILDVLGTKHRRHFRDQWDYVRFAQDQKLNIDFTAGPKRQLPATLR